MEFNGGFLAWVTYFHRRCGIYCQEIFWCIIFLTKAAYRKKLWIDVWEIQFHACLTNQLDQEYQSHKALPTPTQLLLFRTHPFLYSFETIVYTWYFGYKNNVVINGTYSTLISWRPEVSICAVQLSTIRRTLRLKNGYLYRYTNFS